MPPILKEAQKQHGPFTHVLLEVTSSVFTQSAFASEEMAKELLSDVIHTVEEMGALPSFLLHYRDHQGKDKIGFEVINKEFCLNYKIPFLDLGEGLSTLR